MKKNKFKLVLIILMALLIISFGVSLCWGTYKVTPLEVINTLLEMEVNFKIQQY